MPHDLLGSLEQHERLLTLADELCRVSGPVAPNTP